MVNPKKDSELARNEVFGPIMKIFTYDSFDNLIDEINDGEKPLALYFIGKAKGNPRKERLERETSSGMFVVNEVCLQSLNSHLPFGGVGNSGHGCFKGVVGF